MPSPSNVESNVDTYTCSAFDFVAGDMVLTFGLVIHSRLDVEKLEAGLYSCIERKLPRAGARLARRNGLYEFLVPRTFDGDTRPAAFSHSRHDAPFSHLNLPPSASYSHPVVLDAPDEHASLFRAPTTPQSLEAFLRPNTPTVHVHVTTFGEDVTLIGVTVPHLLFDAHALATFLRAWAATLRCEMDSTPKSPRDFSPFDDLYLSTPEAASPRGVEPIRGFYDPGLFATFLIILSFIWQMIREPKEKTRYIRIPATWLLAQKELCMQELTAASGSEKEDWIGSSDVLLAWLAKSLHAHRTDDATPVKIHMPVNLRRLLPEVFKHDYVNNASSTYVAPPITAAQLAQQSVAQTALFLRRALNGYTADLPQLRVENAWLAQPAFKGKQKRLFPAPFGAEYLITSNWRSAQLNEVDFSGASLDSSRDARPAFVGSWPQDGLRMPRRRSGVVCSETDEEIWLSITRTAADWERIRRGGAFHFA